MHTLAGMKVGSLYGTPFQDKLRPIYGAVLEVLFSSLQYAGILYSINLTVWSYSEGGVEETLIFPPYRHHSSYYASI